MAGRSTDIRVVGSSLYMLPVYMRMPLKFGLETVNFVTCARACVTVVDQTGRMATGWGETPLSATWVWPSRLSYEQRENTLKEFCEQLAEAWADFEHFGHPIEVGYAFQSQRLGRLTEQHNERHSGDEPMPHLASLLCCSVFDIGMHDAYGVLHSCDVYQTYNERFMSCDLATFLTADGVHVRFNGLYPQDFLEARCPGRLRAWHLVGGMDPIEVGDLTGGEPNDGYPVLLSDWIDVDNLKCLKVKLRGSDATWDYQRMVRVGTVAAVKQVQWLSADFNCRVTEPDYVNDILDRLRDEHPRIFGMLLYVEQPFGYDLEVNRIDVHSVSARKPLFMDESAHDWQLIKLGRTLGWTGVALKTCKTQTGAILSLCWAKAHGMAIMVQDLTNPMLAQVPHVLLAAHAGTVMGVETNAMQFYPLASCHEAKVHPGLYRRCDGNVDLSSLGGPGFGYQIDRIERSLPPAVCQFGQVPT